MNWTARDAMRCLVLVPRLKSRLALSLVAGLVLGAAGDAAAQGLSDWPGYRYYTPRSYYARRTPPRPRIETVERVEETKTASKQEQSLFAVVSIADQRIAFYGSDGLVAQSGVSTGMRGHATPTGVFSILQKKRWHRSNLYSDAPMPFMQRLTWSGIALHAGALPGYPASHGCIRMPASFAQRVFGATRMGQRVIVSPTGVAPADIAHANLPVPFFSPADNQGEAMASASAPTPTEGETAGMTASAGKLEAVTLTAATIEPKRLNPAEYAEALKRAANGKVEAAARAAKASQLHLVKMTAEATIAARKASGAENALERAEDMLKAATRRAEKARDEDAIARTAQAKTAAEQAAVAARKAADDARAAKAAAEASLASASKTAEDAKAAIKDASGAEKALERAEDELKTATRRAEKAEGEDAVAKAAEAKATAEQAAIVARKTADEARAAKAAAEATLASARKTADEARAAIKDASGAEKALERAEDDLKAATRRAEKAMEEDAVAKAAEARTSAEQAAMEAREAADEARAAKTAAEASLASARKSADEARAAAKDASAARAEAERRTQPVSVFISRKAGRIYVRQDMEKLFEAPVTFTEPERPVGTHMYISTKATEDGAGLKWVAVTMPHEAQDAPKPAKGTRADKDGKDETTAAIPARVLPPETASGAIGRVSIPEETMKRIAELSWVGATVIVSDHGISGETNDTTDFIILTHRRTASR